MPINVNHTKQHLKNFDFKSLFIDELGWDHCGNTHEVSIDSNNFNLNAVAEKRGMAAFLCSPLSNGNIPDYAVRRKIERQAAKSVHEHIIIYTDIGKTIQIWQWVKREAGKPTACREHAYHIKQPGDSLIQKILNLVVTLDEEESITIVDVTGKAKTAFDVEKVTKKFYDRFKNEHDSFLKFIEGIPDDELHRWYALVMLNRLMFIYFIQSKGFLNNDTNYLKNKLAEIRKTGEDTFYKKFLCPLFFEGFAKKASERSSAINKLLGEVPYLNGGLFLKHQIEELHGRHIEIADKAFEKLFEFFDIYHWHLDERLLKKDNEINPDVLGYIFEKYINQKQMGAYYTQEDITGYISKNTIIPFLFDAVRQKCKFAFEGENSIWKLLKNDPDRYVYDSVKLGVIDEKGNIIPESILYDFVQKGMHDPQARMFDRRYNLGEADIRNNKGEKITLPTETWREYVERRKRCLELRNKLVNGEVCNINDFITYNLNILQFAQDVIENCEDLEFLRAFWHAIEQLKALDPTCGSGAFIFAVLNILELLYESCLQRMQIFLDELERSGEKHRADKYGDFKKILKQVAEHPNPRYFIFKSIIVNNLYGVDIMEEAVEICKLRLFLKLVAQVDKVEDIEPLPDIDFNIRAGNTLVGFATYEELKQTLQSDLISLQSLPAIEEKAQDIDRLFRLFQKMQTEQGMDSQDFINAKDELQKRLKALENVLNYYLAGEYGVKFDNKTITAISSHSRENGNPEALDSCLRRNDNYQKWYKSHQPFHWFIEFYGILKNGGFDVTIGNPPYVEYSKVKDEYTIKGYQTETCGNLYAYVMELSLNLLKNNGRFGMIVQLPIVCTDRMKALQKEFLEKSKAVWFANFDDRPARLFDGLEHIRATIVTAQRGKTNTETVYSTDYNRWYSDARSILFELLTFSEISDYLMDGAIPKIGQQIAKATRRNIGSLLILGRNLSRHSRYITYFHNAPQYWIRAMDFAPYFWNERDGEQVSTQVKSINLPTKLDASVITSALNSSLFYWWFIILSDCRHLNMREIENFPIGLDKMSKSVKERLSQLCDNLMDDYKKHAYRKECNYKTTGKVIYDEFYPKHSKPIIDEIDSVLAKHYGFTDEELDFIINYDIKYRMGRESEEDD